jgi:Kef-type K+ transport system membrane component KefB
MIRKLRNILFYATFLLMFGAGIVGILHLGAHLYPSQVPPTSPHTSLEPDSSQLAEEHGPLTAPIENLNHPLGILLVQLVVIILVARGMGKLFRRIGQPSVLGEVVAGILLGPSLLGWIYPVAQTFLFPPYSMGSLQLLSQIGVILFMFTVGTELEIGHLKKRIDATVLVSHASIILPFFLGTMVALYIFPILAPAGISFSAFALFMGVAMSITAFPVLARIVAEQGLSKTPIGNIAIACAAVDDVTAWCLLAVVVALIKATGLTGIVFTIVLALLFIAVMLFFVRPQTQRLFAGPPGANRRIGYVSGMLAFVFASALYTETIGIHPLFGAFLAGVVMPSTNGVKEFVKSRLETVTSVILLPLFFAFTGLRTQIGLLSDWQSLLLCAGIVVVAIAGKFGGSMAAARWTGMSWHDSISIGALMNTRGLVELIALNIGYELGILSPRIFTMMVLMTLITTFMAGPALAFLRRLERETPMSAFEPTPPGYRSVGKNPI